MGFDTDLAHEVRRWEAEAENARALQKRRAALLTLSAVMLSLGAFSADTLTEIQSHVSSGLFVGIRVLLGCALFSLLLVPAIYIARDPWKGIDKVEAEVVDPTSDPLGRKDLYASKLLELPPVFTAIGAARAASAGAILARTRLAATSLRLRNEGNSGLISIIQVPLLAAGALLAVASFCYLIGMESRRPNLPAQPGVLEESTE